ncbi:MAG: spore coat protein [Spirochaetes bacterium]|jgi:N-acetylneuraminate synthase|nr:spore coat protein [Spirochaetota bacterium]
MGLERYFAADSAIAIAEIGTSHDGDRGRARELIDAAADAGAGCIKTQIVYADEIVHPKTGMVSLPGGEVPLFERFRQLEVTPDFFAEMAEHCLSRGVAFLASCFGPRSLQVLSEVGLDTVKIASPELNHAPLLRLVREAGLSAILSTGVSTLADIEHAVEITGNACSAIMHCVTAYPAPEEDYNLRVIGNLAAVFGVPVGVSDHSLDPELVPAAAVVVGARAVEKHFTLSRSGGGLDDRIALEPTQFATMVSAIRGVEGRPSAEAVDELCSRFGNERVARILGDGVKRLARSEQSNYGRSNRSILATRDIVAGEPVGDDNAAALRSEKNLIPGLSPFHWDDIRGARAARGIESGSGIRWEHLLAR